MVNNYLIEKGNNAPIMRVHLNNEKGTALLEMATVEENHRLLKVGSLKILG
jgi:hypothetical protein